MGPLSVRGPLHQPNGTLMDTVQFTGVIWQFPTETFSERSTPQWKGLTLAHIRDECATPHLRIVSGIFLKCHNNTSPPHMVTTLILLCNVAVQNKSCTAAPSGLLVRAVKQGAQVLCSSSSSTGHSVLQQTSTGSPPSGTPRGLTHQWG